VELHQLDGRGRQTSAVVEPILKGRSPHSLPIESPLVPGARRGRIRGGRENVESRQTEGDSVGTAALDRIIRTGRTWRQRGGVSPGGGQWGILWRQGFAPGPALDRLDGLSIEPPAEPQIEPGSGRPTDSWPVALWASWNSVWKPGYGRHTGLHTWPDERGLPQVRPHRPALRLHQARGSSHRCCH
jgi:hypothetical protein